MKVFRYQEDRWPVAIMASYFALDIVVFFSALPLWFLVGWFLLGIIPKACICAWNHHHQHVPTFRKKIFNRLLELMYGFQTGITGHGWVLHHVIGHHQNYLDQEKDESRWKRKDGTTMGDFEYSLNVSLTAYPRAFQVGLRHTRQLKIFLKMLAITVGLLAFFLWYDWLSALFVFVLPMATSLFLTAQATYKHHSDLDTDNEYEASYNILNPLYNKMTGNLGYHTAHHVQGGVHWSRLPEFHKKIEHKIPRDLYIEPGFPWSFHKLRHVELPPLSDSPQS